jgi:hypothetical protein
MNRLRFETWLRERYGTQPFDSRTRFQFQRGSHHEGNNSGRAAGGNHGACRDDHTAGADLLGHIDRADLLKPRTGD